MKKMKITAIVIGILLIVITNLVVLITPMKLELELGPAFWTSFAFLNAGILTATGCVLVALKGKEDKVMNAGVIVFASYAYLADEITLANLFVFNPNWPFKAALLSQLLSFLVYVLLIAIILFSFFYRANSHKEIKEKKNFINSLELKVDKAILFTSDASLKKPLNELKEAIKYSDPMSNESAKVEEDNLVMLLDKIVEKVDSNEDGVLELIEKAQKHLKLRNEICLKNK